MKKSFFSIILLLSMLLIITGCGKEQNVNSVDESQIQIYSTVYPLQDFAEKIGGDYVTVSSVYPAGADEHTFEPTQKEIIDIANSDLFFYIGYGLEGFVKKIEPILLEEGVSTFAIGEAIHLESDKDLDSHSEEADEHSEESFDEHGHSSDDAEHSHGDVNPHLWLDPLYAKQMAQTILDILIDKMPEQASYFEKNFASIESEFDELHAHFEELADTAENKSFIVSHSAYEAWEDRYGFEQLSISGISTSDEPSQKQLLAIIDEVNAKELQYILVEQNVGNNLVEVIQKESNIKALPIHNLSVLTKEDIDKEKDYFSIMASNLETLDKALNNN